MRNRELGDTERERKGE